MIVRMTRQQVDAARTAVEVSIERCAMSIEGVTQRIASLPSNLQEPMLVGVFFTGRQLFRLAMALRAIEGASDED